MNLEQFLDTSRREHTELSLRSALGARRIDAAEALEKNKQLLERYTAVITAFDGLERCSSAGYMMREHVRWMFVAQYTASQVLNTVKPTALECVIVPEAIVTQNRHLPCHDALATSGACAMRTVSFTSQQIAEEAVAVYASANVRIGEYEDALIEMCRACGEKSVVVCKHSIKVEEDDHEITLYRLCMHCPNLQEIARMTSLGPTHGDLDTLFPRTTEVITEGAVAPTTSASPIQTNPDEATAPEPVR